MKLRESQSLDRREIFQLALKIRESGALYDLNNTDQESNFRGSIDRFSWIAFEFRNEEKILDVGPGPGLLLSLLHELGHECFAIDIVDNREKFPGIFLKKDISFQHCNVEVDPIPFPDNYFDGVVCCQVLEHFSHSHLHAIREMHRVLKPGGIIELDVPNVVSFRNRSRILRGKNITYDYEAHYLHADPIFYKNRAFYPDRHNREFTIKELKILLEAGEFKNIRCSFLKSRRYRTGLSRVRSLGTMLKDMVPSLRKSLIGFAEK